MHNTNQEARRQPERSLKDRLKTISERALDRMAQKSPSVYANLDKGLAMRWMEPGRDFELFCGREILIESRRPHRLVARDGERSRMAAPFRFEVKRDALEVLVPGDGA